MASLQRTIQFIFTATNQTGGVIAAVGTGINSLGDKAKDIVSPMATLNNTILGIEAALGALAIALGTKAYQEAVKFEDSVVNLKKQMQDTSAIAGYVDQLKALALQYGINANDAVKSAADFLQAGYDQDAALGLVTQSLKLASAGELEYGKAAEYISRTLLGFQVDQKDTNKVLQEAEHIVKVVAGGADAYATNSENLAEALARTSPIMKLLNASYEDAADLLIPVIGIWGSGSEAANGMRSSLSQLLSTQKPVLESLQLLGLSQDKFNAGQQTGIEFIRDVAAKFIQLSDAQKLSVATKIADTEQAPKFIASMEAIAKGTVNVREALKSVASVDEQVRIGLEKSSTVIAVATESWRQLLTTVGDKYKVELTGVIDATGEFARALDTAFKTGAFDDFFDLLRPQLANLEALLRDVAKALPDALKNVNFQPILDSLGGLGKAFGEIFSGADIRTTEGLTKALQGVVDGIASLIRYSTGAVESIGPFVGQLGKLLDWVTKLSPETLELAGNIGGFASQANILLPALNGVSTALIALGTGPAALANLGKIFTTVATALSGPAGLVALVGGLAFALTSLSGAGQAAADAISPAFWDAIFSRVDVAFRKVGETFGLLEEKRPQEVIIIKDPQLEAIKELRIRTDAWLDGMGKGQETLEQHKQIIKDIAPTMEKLGMVYNESQQAYVSLDKAAGSLAETQRKLNEVHDASADKVSKSKDGTKEYSNTLISSEAAQKRFTDQIIKTQGPLATVNTTLQNIMEDALEPYSKEAERAEERFHQFSQTLNKAAYEADGVKVSLEKGVVTFTQFSKISDEAAGKQALADAKAQGLAKAMEKVGDSMFVATGKSEDFMLALEKLASDERLKKIEITAEIDKKKLEEDAKVAIATIEKIAEVEIARIDLFGKTLESISEVSKTVGDNINNVVDQIGALDAADQLASQKLWIFEQQLKKENERMDQQLELQKELTKAQLREIDARTDRLRSGDAMIKISSDGLEPALEAFMWNILEKIQLRVNAEAGAFLLGVA